MYKFFNVYIFYDYNIKFMYTQLLHGSNSGNFLMILRLFFYISLFPYQFVLSCCIGNEQVAAQRDIRRIRNLKHGLW